MKPEEFDKQFLAVAGRAKPRRPSTASTTGAKQLKEVARAGQGGKNTTT